MVPLETVLLALLVELFANPTVTLVSLDLSVLNAPVVLGLSPEDAFQFLVLVFLLYKMELLEIAALMPTVELPARPFVILDSLEHFLPNVIKVFGPSVGSVPQLLDLLVPFFPL